MLLVCLIWGFNFSVTKSALDQIPPLPFTAVRFAARQPAALAGPPRWSRVRRAARRERSGSSILLGIVGNTCYQLAFMLGLARTTATNSALILSTVPTVVARLRRSAGLERITPADVAGHRAGDAGRGAGDRDPRRRLRPGTLRGDLLTVLAVLCWAGYTVGPSRRSRPE